MAEQCPAQEPTTEGMDFFERYLSVWVGVVYCGRDRAREGGSGIGQVTGWDGIVRQ